MGGPVKWDKLAGLTSSNGSATLILGSLIEKTEAVDLNIQGSDPVDAVLYLVAIDRLGVVSRYCVIAAGRRAFASVMDDADEASVLQELDTSECASAIWRSLFDRCVRGVGDLGDSSRRGGDRIHARLVVWVPSNRNLNALGTGEVSEASCFRVLEAAIGAEGQFGLRSRPEDGIEGRTIVEVGVLGVQQITISALRELGYCDADRLGLFRPVSVEDLHG